MVDTPPDLPTASVAEFRMAAWSHWRDQGIMSAFYMPAIGFRGGIGALFAVLGAVGLVRFAVGTPPPDGRLGPVLGTLGLGALGWFLISWKVRSRRREKELNSYLVHRSQEIDHMHRSGRIPLTPPGWDKPVPDTLSNSSPH